MIEKYLTDMQRGLVYMFLGFVLLFHTLGIFAAGFKYILIAFSLFMIVGGFLRADLQVKVKQWYHKLRKKEHKK